jgi:K+ transporter
MSPAGAASRPSDRERTSNAEAAGRARLALGAIGVVFGDIGTSPLYTLHECLWSRHGVAPTRENVLGVVSLVVWSITMVVTVKYLAFLMRADNQGEGGIMALLALVPEERGRRVGRIGALAGLVIAGAALLFGDGVITPASSVLSAMEGLEIATHRFERWVVPITVVVLAGLFALQPKGTGRIGRFFGPVMVVWLLLVFLSFDIPFLLANVLKFRDAGYIPVAAAVMFVLVMASWRIGREYLHEETGRLATSVEAFRARLAGEILARIPGTAIVLTSNRRGIPPVLNQLASRFRVLHENVVLLTVRTARVPEVGEVDRMQVEPLGEGLSRVVLCYGFMQSPDVPAAVPRALAALGISGDPGGVQYLVGRATLVVTRKGRMGRITEPVFAFLARNTRSTSHLLSIPPEQVVAIRGQLDL